jgi:hypothetical protein
MFRRVTTIAGPLDHVMGSSTFAQETAMLPCTVSSLHSTCVFALPWASYDVFHTGNVPIRITYAFTCLPPAGSRSLTLWVFDTHDHWSAFTGCTGRRRAALPFDSSGHCERRRQRWQGRVAAPEPSDADPTSVERAVWLGLALPTPRSAPPMAVWPTGKQKDGSRRFHGRYFYSVLCIIVFYALLRKWVWHVQLFSSL